MATSALQRVAPIGQLPDDEVDPSRRATLGQFMTPPDIAKFMASLFASWPSRIELLDPGAGLGSLTEAFASEFIKRTTVGARLSVTNYEVDELIERKLAAGFAKLAQQIRESGRSLVTNVFNRDFIAEGTFELSFAGKRYTHVILNPPYRKIGASSRWRKQLRTVGIDTVNLYSAFLAISVALANDGGEIVAVVPRSFCNGTYFRRFRCWLLDRVALKHIHLFESRTKAFKEDRVLQENVIIHLIRGGRQGKVTISTSHDRTFDDYIERQVSIDDIVKRSDPEKFIHVPTTEPKEPDGTLFARTLEDLGIDVATGPVVDFRVREHLLATPDQACAPLLYAHHFAGGQFQWPRAHRKPNAISINDETRKWLMPRGWYVITKRFSSKEERRRVVAYVVDPECLPQPLYGFENHLNVIHRDRKGLPADIAYGLALFLNSTLVDAHFRAFSGHTQVNATDLRSMKFPETASLVRFGNWARKRKGLTQKEIDAFIQPQ